MITGPWYDRLKLLAQIVLPALGTLYVALAALWDLPKPQEVVGTIVAVDTFLGVLLGLSQARYVNNEVATGDLNLEGDKYSLALDDLPENLEDVTELRLAVNNPKRTSKQGKGKKPHARPLATLSRHRTGTASSWVTQNRPN